MPVLRKISRSLKEPVSAAEHHGAAVTLPRPNLKTMLDRPTRLRGLALLALFLMILGILGGMIWRNLERLDTIQAYVSYSHRIQDSGLKLQQALVDTLAGGAPDSERIRKLSNQLRALIREDSHLATDTPARLAHVAASLERLGELRGDNGDKPELSHALRAMRGILDTETDLREKVLEDISRDTLAELELATGTLTVLLLLGWFFVRRRILAPLNDLKRLLLNLAKEEFTPIETRHLDPLLLPVFNSYNIMTSHLRELEETKRTYAQSLEQAVRSATQTLLEQQRSLARAERLAAVGELAASLAHELRNPLAGIQMSCANLRQEVDNPEHMERLDLIGAELKRMTRLLNDLLDQGRQAPTPARDFDLAVLARELVALTRYQMPAHISMTHHVPDNLICHLPECNLRQALLNLLLNAAEAVGDKSGTVDLRAHLEDGMVHIEVVDDGPGFPEDMLVGGIRPFRTGKLGGTGLGLAIVQRFARDVGGQFKLSNCIPHGGCVTLTLPCRDH